MSVRYRPSIICAILWLLALSLWCGLVLDLGESLQAFLEALGVFVVLLLLILLRRPATPSRLDLLLVGWALPIVFFALLLLHPLVWHLWGIR